MLVKIIILFLAAMALLAMIGKFLFPNAMPRLGRKRGNCRACGRPRIGRTPCACGKSA